MTTPHVLPKFKFPGTMGRGSDHRTPPAEHSQFTAPEKPKRPPVIEEDFHNHKSKKKQRLISKTKETLTLKKHRRIHDPSSASDSNFAVTALSHVHSQSFTRTLSHHSHKNRRRRKSTITDGHRNWVYSTRNFSDYSDKVVFVSYNILGVENASKHPDLYYNISPNIMDWEHRKKLIRAEINQYNPSILCFQEVDRFDDLDNFLQKDGFSGVYQPRTGEASDGCAIFWKKEIFTLLHDEDIEFQKFGLRDNVAQLCVFKMAQNNTNKDVNMGASGAPSSRCLLVGNIHVLFNPKRGDIKLGQIRLFLEKAHHLSQEWGSIPFVIGGDLNSLPQSAMYQFLASSELDIQLHDRRKISGQRPMEYQTSQSQRRASRPIMHSWNDEELRLATGVDGVSRLMHHFKLYSAYAGVPASFRTRDNLGEPLATSYHSQFMGTVDYIWHTGELVPVRVLETLPIDILKKTRGLPSKRWGSDHLALVCELAFADDESGT